MDRRLNTEKENKQIARVKEHFDHMNSDCRRIESAVSKEWTSVEDANSMSGLKKIRLSNIDFLMQDLNKHWDALKAEVDMQ